MHFVFDLFICGQYSWAIFTSQKWQLGSPAGAQVTTTPDHAEGLPSPLPIPPVASFLPGGLREPPRQLRVAEASAGQVSVSAFFQRRC